MSSKTQLSIEKEEKLLNEEQVSSTYIESETRYRLNPVQSVSSSLYRPNIDEYYIRSYTCNFCKKGFSNAQALGGHMNIHRRDRAKLRKTSSNDEDHSQESSELSTSKDKDNVDDMGKKEALPLFVEASSSLKKENMYNPNVSKDDSGLDLELRLGSSPLMKNNTFGI
ncbi:unnamed protein product [Amaranthus hypochondriacus]